MDEKKKNYVIQRVKKNGFWPTGMLNFGEQKYLLCFADKNDIILEIDAEEDEFRLSWSDPYGSDIVTLPENGDFCRPFSGSRQFGKMHQQMLDIVQSREEEQSVRENREGTELH